MDDFNAPRGNDNSHLMTQPARHNEFNVNLAHVDLRLERDDLRGALALHTGTSVEANYAGESNNRELAQLLHEAWIGYRIMNGLWVDAGIYPAPYGFENWLSKDNKSYTRSLVADFSPYYQTGIKVSWQVSDKIDLAGHLFNGWQNIAETNSGKAAGVTLAYMPSTSITFIYNNFIGNEMPDSVSAALRLYHDLCTRITVSPALEFDLTTDYGIQRVNSDHRSWMGAALIGRYIFSDHISLSVRTEYYNDANQVIVSTHTDNGFVGYGASLNLDTALLPQLLWRNEIRMLSAKYPVFPTDNGLSKQTGFIVSSLSLTFD